MDDETPLVPDLYKFLPLFSYYCINNRFFPVVILVLYGMSPIWKARNEMHDLLVSSPGR